MKDEELSPVPLPAAQIRDSALAGLPLAVPPPPDHPMKDEEPSLELPPERPPSMSGSDSSPEGLPTLQLPPPQLPPQAKSGKSVHRRRKLLLLVTAGVVV